MTRRSAIGVPNGRVAQHSSLQEGPHASSDEHLHHPASLRECRVRCDENDVLRRELPAVPQQDRRQQTTGVSLELVGAVEAEVVDCDELVQQILDSIVAVWVRRVLTIARTRLGPIDQAGKGERSDVLEMVNGCFRRDLVTEVLEVLDQDFAREDVRFLVEAAFDCDRSSA